MKYDPKIHHRRSIRLHGYDYSLPGAYYVTLCALGKQCVFGRVVDDHMHENECGKIVREQWFESAQIRPEFALDAFIVMPNHLHGILWILGRKRERLLMGSRFAPPIVGPSGARPRGERGSPLPVFDGCHRAKWHSARAERRSALQLRRPRPWVLGH